MEKIKKICVVMSGNSSSGKSTAIAGILSRAADLGVEVDLAKGFDGIIQPNFTRLSYQFYGDYISGAILTNSSSRCPDFMMQEYRDMAVQNLRNSGYSALIVIGGDGSLRAAGAMEKDFPCVFIPATIDNDMGYTDYSIGYDTALNAALWSFDRMRDTIPHPHEHCRLVEVPGRESKAGGFAYNIAIASGALTVLTQEKGVDLELIRKLIHKRKEIGKNSHLIVVAESTNYDLREIAQQIESHLGRECRYIALGHIVRGGVLTAYDRIMGVRFGEYAMNLIAKNELNMALGLSANHIEHMAISTACGIEDGKINWPLVLEND